jgi:3',5'-cyclic-AMP phosphodiesterase
VEADRPRLDELLGGGAYVGRLGEEQTEWLQRELETTPRSTHIVLASHIPIQTALPFTDAALRQDDGSFRVPGGWGSTRTCPS